MTFEQQAAEMVKWLVEEKGVKLKKAYYTSMYKMRLHKIDGIRKEYQKIKKVNRNQLSIF